MVGVNDLIDFAFEVFSGHQKISSSGNPSTKGRFSDERGIGLPANASAAPRQTLA
jgi:hypothetical protein